MNDRKAISRVLGLMFWTLLAFCAAQPEEDISYSVRMSKEPGIDICAQLRIYIRNETR